MAINGKQLAKMIGVSEAAISMAMNNKPGVSKKRREEIMNIAKEKGYDFSNLRVKKNIGTIYFIVYSEHGTVVTDSLFFLSVEKGIKEQIKEEAYNYEIIVCKKINDVIKHIHLIENKPYVGVILLATEISEKDFNSLPKFHVPLVILDANYTDPKYDIVSINNYQGGYLAAKYLIDTFHCIPSYLASAYPITNFSKRMEGFNHAIHELGFSTSRVNVIKLMPSEEDAFADMNYLLNRDETIERCYFADNDLIATGVIRALKKHGYHIPKDVAIVGFDDIAIRKYNLTSVLVDKEGLGRVAVTTLFNRIKRPQDPINSIEINTSLVIRESSSN